MNIKNKAEFAAGCLFSAARYNCTLNCKAAKPSVKTNILWPQSGGGMKYILESSAKALSLICHYKKEGYVPLQTFKV